MKIMILAPLIEDRGLGRETLHLGVEQIEVSPASLPVGLLTSREVVLTLLREKGFEYPGVPGMWVMPSSILSVIFES